MQTLLIIGYVWPEPTATAAGSRMLQIIYQFQNTNYKVVFASPAQKPELSFNLGEIDVDIELITLNNTSFDVFLKNLNPSIVIFDRFMMEEQFGWRVVNVCPNAIRILDSEDLHFLRKARQFAVKKGMQLPDGMITSEDAKREIASIFRCDVTLTISEYEMEYLKNIYKIPEQLLWYFPFLVEPDNSEKPLYEDRKDFMFIGNFIHAPNWDAVLQLKIEIWPAIKKRLPKANLFIYGGYPSDKVFQLNNKKEGFCVVGRAEDVNKVMKKTKVCLAPIRFGAGLKGKLIDAMQNNTPFVTSNIGAEGMFGNTDFTVSIASENSNFIEKAIKLYEQEDLWLEMSLKGKHILKNRFNINDYTQIFKNRLEDLLKNYKTYRAHNFIGGMLQHHTLKSTIYLSKWIEEKNKS